MALTKSDILSARDRSPVAVSVPEWRTKAGEETVYVIGLRGDEVARLSGLENDEAFRLACAMGMCDESGQPLGFSEAEVLLLGEKSSAALRRVYDKIEKLSGLGDDEDAGKNSPGTKTEGSGSS